MNHFQVQQIAKNTMEYLKTQICVGQSLLEIRNICESKMLELGADSFWYYDIGAFVFSGDETAVSVSGRKYKTSDRIIRENDIITIDLSPQCRHIWGDFARTIVIENGRVVEDINEICNDEWRNGLIFENQLHNALYKIVNKDTTFEDLYFNINNLIEKSGYINLDFNGNLGHTINRHKFRRKYIEKGNKKKISCADYFTFEPHISIPNSKFGFKKRTYIFSKIMNWCCCKIYLNRAENSALLFFCRVCYNCIKMIGENQMVREATPNDLNQLLELYLHLHEKIVPENNEVLNDTWCQIMNDENHHIIVAEENGKIVSSCVCVIIPNLTRNVRPYAFIENVVTAENYRHRGFASACLSYARDIAKKNNCYKMMLLTGSKNESTLEFYKKAGYNCNDKTAFILWL